MTGTPLVYREADEDEYALFQAIRDKWHGHLDGYGVRFFFRNKPQVLDGRKCAATANRANTLVSWLADMDGWVEVWEAQWFDDPEWRAYLLDHELSHFAIRKGSFTLVGHDQEDFLAVMGRHDPRVSGLRSIIETRSAAREDGE
jgi:hypothetical protein